METPDQPIPQIQPVQPDTMPLTPDQQADQAAAAGKWEGFAQPGAEQAAGGIATEASAEMNAAMPESWSAEPVMPVGPAPEAEETPAPSGFEKAESGLFVPEEGAQVSMGITREATPTGVSLSKDPGLADEDPDLTVTTAPDVLISDTRRNTLEGVEAAFQAHQEALRGPLSDAEAVQATTTLAQVIETFRIQTKETPENRQQLHDMGGDKVALNDIQRMLSGDTLGMLYSDDKANKEAGMDIGQRLDALVKIYGHYVTENFDEQSHIGSMGGTVLVGKEGGELHHNGYTNGNAYTIVRARQIWEKMQADPKMIREKVLAPEDGALPDISWIINEPAVMKPEDITVLERAS